MLVGMAPLGVGGNEPPVKPVTKMFPGGSTASAVAPPAVGPPRSVPKTLFPAGSALPMYASVQGPGTDPIGNTDVQHAPPPGWVCAAPAVTCPLLVLPVK